MTDRRFLISYTTPSLTQSRFQRSVRVFLRQLKTKMVALILNMLGNWGLKLNKIKTFSNKTIDNAELT